MRKSLAFCAVVAMVLALALPASAEDPLRVKLPATVGEDPVVCGEVELTETVEGWFQVNQYQYNNGIRVTTFHQTRTYTNPTTGETLVLQNTGVGRAYFDDTGEFVRFEVGGLSHISEAVLNHGLQSSERAVGHEISLCDELT